MVAVACLALNPGGDDNNNNNTATAWQPACPCDHDHYHIANTYGSWTSIGDLYLCRGVLVGMQVESEGAIMAISLMGTNISAITGG